jgi:hypothetical protein
VGEVSLQSRLDFLLRTQNADGGWGYFPGKQSWMEPTVYALLALQGRPEGRTSVEKAWRLLLSWQSSDGSWRPGTTVQDGTWVTALGVLAACGLNTLDGPGTRGIGWLMDVSGAESRWTVRVMSYFHFLKTDVNVNHRGWPWRPGTSAWIEPTALTILALKKSMEHRRDGQVAARVREGEELILSRRDRDGGWNSGNPSVLKYDLPSYPETTALALLGLQGRSGQELSVAMDTARRFYGGCKSSLAKAWLTIAFRCYGQSVADPGGTEPDGNPDVLLCALQALGSVGGNYHLLKTGAIA